MTHERRARHRSTHAPAPAGPFPRLVLPGGRAEGVDAPLPAAPARTVLRSARIDARARNGVPDPRP